MKLLALNCNQCGAPLEVPERAKFVTCNFCSVRLSVQRTDEVSYTEAIEEIQVRTREMAEDLEDLKLQGELDRLDKDWAEKRESLMVRNQDGTMSVPGKVMAVVGGVAFIVFGVFWISVTSSIDAPGFLPPLGVVFIGVGIFQMVRLVGRADAFEKARLKYQADRRRVMGRQGERARDGAGDSLDSEEG